MPQPHSKPVYSSRLPSLPHSSLLFRTSQLRPLFLWPRCIERLLPVSSLFTGILSGLILMSVFILFMFFSVADNYTCSIPSTQFQPTLKRWGRDRRSLTLMDRPIRVAMLQ